MFLYILRNNATGKVYYGITANVSRRMSSHRCAASKRNTPLYASIRKHGWEGFSVEVIAEGEVEDIKQMEIALIASDPDCYNLHEGGSLGFDVSSKSAEDVAEWKAKLRTARSGRTPALGMKHSEQTKKLCGTYGKARWDKYGRYPAEVLDLSFAEAYSKYGISRTHYYRLKKAAAE